ncbi:hypothetical protein ATE84_0540 [Aquimarina sp. MAR_2010_214]|uniref:hypothetical protein n=1 Tax=Aquimarina sp. MAR_2010_214 TaxID=1250026 RepID=UPI000C6FEAA8|nr:hypothetical protein [Aquimarina sp. MAR_2010_214]PKV48540.1 hypothetical protein ATE84_0540 [Aquimarina sp. MAR_2010_214]
MKNSLKYISFLLITFLMIGCQKDELPIVEDGLSQKAKSWYEKNQSKELANNFFFYGKPDWENFNKIGSDIYFPIISELENDEDQVSKDYGESWRYIKPYLILSQNGENNFIESLKVFVSEAQENLKGNNTFNLPFLHYDANNNRILDSKPNEEETYGENSKLPSFLEISQKSNCETYYVIETTSVNGNPVHIDILYSYQVCSGGGGSGGGSGDGIGGGGGDGSLPTADEEKAPDCSSFPYKKVANNWKATVSKGVYFNVVLIDPNNQQNQGVYHIDFGNELFTFETYNIDRFDNEFGNANASEVTAAAMHNAMKEIADYYRYKYGTSQIVIEQRFKEVLKREFNYMTGGGKMRIGNPFGLTPTQFTHAWFGFGNCN